MMLQGSSLRVCSTTTTRAAHQNTCVRHINNNLARVHEHYTGFKPFPMKTCAAHKRRLYTTLKSTLHYFAPHKPHLQAISFANLVYISI